MREAHVRRAAKHRPFDAKTPKTMGYTASHVGELLCEVFLPDENAG